VSKRVDIAVSAMLCVAANAPVGASWLAYICLVPWMISVQSAVGGAVSGTVLGTAVGFALGVWIPVSLISLPLDATPTWIAWFIVALFVKGLPFGALGALCGCSGAMRPDVRAVCLAIGAFGIDALVSLPVIGAPWMLLGHSQAGALGVAQLAAVGGVPLVSAACVGVNAALACVWLARSESRPLAWRTASVAIGAITALLLGGVAVSGYVRGEPALDEPSTRLLVLQPVIPREERWLPKIQASHLTTTLELARRAIRHERGALDLVVLPETVVTTPWDKDEGFANSLADFTRETGARVALGVAFGAREGEGAYRNSFALYSRQGELEARVDKAIGVPFVESGPKGIAKLLWPLLSGMNTGPKMELAPSLNPIAGGSEFTALLCYEVYFPFVAAARRTAGSLAILNLGDDAWGVDDTMSRQVLAAAVFRAIEQRSSLVRVANAGISAEIDPYGRIVRQLPFREQGYFVADLRRTPPAGVREALALAIVMGSGALIGLGVAFATEWRVSRMRLRFAMMLALAISLSSPATAQEVSLLRLDGLSFVSLDGKEVFGIPAGSTIGFRFAKGSETSIPFTIQPTDVSIPPITTSDGATLTYALASTAFGSLQKVDGSTSSIQFSATITTGLSTAEGRSTAKYSLIFTTEKAAATSADGVRSVEIDGMKLVNAARHVQLVGAVTNRGDAYAGPGVAVTTVLSGTFDQLPEFE
jgi:apolipoprotein N-acyltransferase